MDSSEDLIRHIGDEIARSPYKLTAKNEALVHKAKNTITAASRLLRRKIPQSGHFLTSKKFWMQTVPDQDVDVVITFPPDCSESTVLWFKTRLETIPGLIIHTKSITTTKGSQTHPNCYAFHVSASYQGYLQGLEQMQVFKLVKEEHGGGSKEFTIKESSHFQGVENLNEFLTSQERQSIILHLLHSLRAEKHDVVADRLSFLEGEAIIPRSLSAKVIFQVFPIHDQCLLDRLKKTWVQQIWQPQPILQIKHYFGVKIALYFAWLGHYTTALSIPAFVGLFFWLFFYGVDGFLEDLGFVLFAFFNVIWATLYLASWKRRSSVLAYEWGTADQRQELLAEPRPLFKGQESISDITGKPERVYPEWRRNLFRYLVTCPVIFCCLVVVFVLVICILELQQWWDQVLLTKGLFQFLSYLPKILLACVIPILDGVYSKIAVWLNDQENYREEEKYEDHLVVKLILFQFVNSFLALFYTAFYLQDMEKLKELLAALLITRQVMGNIKESLLPYIQQQFKFAKLSFDLYGALSPTDERHKKNDDDHHSEDTDQSCSSTNNSRPLSQVEMEGTRPPYEGTFEDYLEMFIQFGYVTLFSSAYPLAGVCAFINNMLEIRSDAFKLCCVHQRPFGQRVKNIGSWQNAMEMMGIVAVMVNCTLIGLSGQVSRMFPNITATQTFLLVIILEHVMLMLKVVIAYAIPDIPSWVAHEMAKIEYRRREIEKLASLNFVISGLSESGIQTAASNSLDTVDKSIQTDEQQQHIESPQQPPELHFDAANSNIVVNVDSGDGAFGGHQVRDSLSSLSSAEVDQFKAMVSRSNGNLFIRTNVQPNADESGAVKKIRTSADRPIPSSRTGKNEMDSHTKLLYQRMASDTDLWLGLKARQSKYKTLLEVTQEVSPVAEDKEAPMPAAAAAAGPSDSACQPAKSPARHAFLDPEELEKKLKAKRALFSSKGRSLSLASFKLLPPVKTKLLKHHHPMTKMSKTVTNSTAKLVSRDEKYLEENQAHGELDMLNLESLININDVHRKRSSK